MRTRFAESAIGNVIASEIMQVISKLMLNAMDALPSAIAPVLHLRVHCYQLGIHLTLAETGPASRRISRKGCSPLTLPASHLAPGWDFGSRRG